MLSVTVFNSGFAFLRASSSSEFFLEMLPGSSHCPYPPTPLPTCRPRHTARCILRTAVKNQCAQCIHTHAICSTSCCLPRPQTIIAICQIALLRIAHKSSPLRMGSLFGYKPQMWIVSSCWAYGRQLNQTQQEQYRPAFMLQTQSNIDFLRQLSVHARLNRQFVRSELCCCTFSIV